MGHNILSDKLDQIQKEDLGIHFGESLLWEDLSAQLGEKETRFVERKLLIAACITVLILLFPIVFMIDTKPAQLAIETAILSPEIAPISENSEDLIKAEKVKKAPIYSVDRKGVDLELASTLEIAEPNLEPIQIQKGEKVKRQLFADQDISVIQASLGTPSIGKEKSVSLRAQLHTSSQPVQLNNQALKITLFEKSNHE